VIDLAAIDANGTGRLWDEAPLLPDTVGWVELEENGWGSLKAWAAGPGRVGRMPQDDSSRRVKVSCETGGVITSRDEPFTPADRAGLEDSINRYLADAGVPPRPVGFTWFLRLPDDWPADRDFAEEFDRFVNTSPAIAADGVMPDLVLPVMREAVRSLYR
jgi:hypothetical protein